MIAITIKNLKNFMNQLLLSDTFDRFQVSEVQITTFATFLLTESFIIIFMDQKIPKNVRRPDRHKSSGAISETTVFAYKRKTYTALL